MLSFLNMVCYPWTMPRTFEPPPKGATALWHWMHDHEVTIEALAEQLDITPNHLGLIRRGKQPPTKAMIEKIAEVTKKLEASKGAKRPRGVEPASWFD